MSDTKARIEASLALADKAAWGGEIERERFIADARTSLFAMARALLTVLAEITDCREYAADCDNHAAALHAEGRDDMAGLKQERATSYRVIADTLERAIEQEMTRNDRR